METTQTSTTKTEGVPPVVASGPEIVKGDAKEADAFKKGICFRLTVGRPDLVKTVRLSQAKQAGLLAAGASEKHYSMRKKTLTSERYDAIVRLDTEIRDFVRLRSLPSIVAKGVYVIPLPLVVAVDDKVEDYKKLKRPVKVEQFLAGYDTDVETARKEIGEDMWRQSDYRTVDQLRQAFYVDTAFIDLGVPTVLQELSGDVWARERERAQASFVAATDEMRQVLRSSMAELVDHMVDRLQEDVDPDTGEPKSRSFKPSMVSKFAEFLSTVDFRDLTDDKELRALADRAKSLLYGVDDTRLRTTSDTRRKVVSGMVEIKARLDTMVTDAPRRRLMLD